VRAVLVKDACGARASYSVGKTVTAARAKLAPMAGPGSSGTFSTGIGQLRNVMRRYISPILVDSVLTRALETHPVAGRGAGALHAVTEDCMIGLRLFVKEQDLPALMLELAEILEAHDGR
jgi:hypothetical protein